MQEALIWDTRVLSVTYNFEPGRSRFFMEVATVPEWSWLVLESGRFRYRIGTGKEALSGECHPGDWLLCPPQEVFHRHMLEPCSFHFARFVVSNQALLALRGVGTLRNAARLRANLHELRGTPGSPLGPEWAGHLILDSLRCALRERHLHLEPRKQDEEMMLVRSRLLEECIRPVSLEALAREYRLPPPAFYRRFKQATGVGPQAFLLECRLDRARQLLLETDLTVDAVARGSGFAGGIYFSRLWTRRYGTSPARYRREHRV